MVGAERLCEGGKLSLVAEPRTVEDRHRGGLVRIVHDSAILVGQRWDSSHTWSPAWEPQAICKGRHAIDAAWGMDAKAWRARTVEMSRPYMKGTGTAASLLAGCELQVVQAAPSVGGGSRTTL